ncbi:MAG: 30S ribosomal protein S17 [Deltaproteobacteria bacterium RBG_13_65_10]|nr:MAG: 30S ribosomal protein S17 [Deltaproteobacteria bacterium RBG_13_65_10]
MNEAADVTKTITRGRRKTRVGVVTSDGMEKTRVVSVERLVQHPRYKKFIRRRQKFKAHDETNASHVGDKVQITEMRPLSREKRWKVSRIIEKAR